MCKNRDKRGQRICRCLQALAWPDGGRHGDLNHGLNSANGQC